VEREILPVAKEELHTQKGKKMLREEFLISAKYPNAPPSIPDRHCINGDIQYISLL
jgi:nitrate reductase cytochrome c-type subunit